MLAVMMSWCLYGCCVEYVRLGGDGGGCVIDADADSDADSDADVEEDGDPEADAEVTPCEVPPGEYSGILRYTGGDCALEENLDGTTGSMSVGSGVQCGAAWFMFLRHEDDCSYATLYRAEGDLDGLLPSSRVTMSTSCSGGYTCTNTYTIDLEPDSE